MHWQSVGVPIMRTAEAQLCAGRSTTSSSINIAINIYAPPDHLLANHHHLHREMHKLCAAFINRAAGGPVGKRRNQMLRILCAHPHLASPRRLRSIPLNFARRQRRHKSASLATIHHHHHQPHSPRAARVQCNDAHTIRAGRRPAIALRLRSRLHGAVDVGL